MKNIIIIIALLILSNSCDDEVSKNTNIKTSDAIVIGYDTTLCACCGGIMLDIDEGISYPDSLRHYYQWQNFEEFEINILNDSILPYKVRIDYTIDTNACYNSIGIVKVLEFIVIENR